MTTGASNDIERATKTALGMIKRYGMSASLGPRTFGKREEMVFLGREISEERDYGDKIAEEIDDEVRHLINSAYRQAQQLLIDNKPKLVQVAEYLIEHEAISGDALTNLFRDNPPGTEPEPAMPEAPTPSPYAPPGSSGNPGRAGSQPGPVLRQRQHLRADTGRRAWATTDAPTKEQTDNQGRVSNPAP